MSFDIPQFHIPENSPEARVVERIMNAEKIGPTEAVRLILRQANSEMNPAKKMIGLLSSDEDAAIMDEVMELVAESRQTQTTRKIGL